MMLKTQQQAALGARASRPALAPLARARRAAVVRRATEGKEQPESVQESSGFVAYDSAGQSNMYPVYTKAYSSSSPSASSNATLGYAIAAGAVAIAAIAIGLSALGKSGPADLTQFKALSDYAAAFAAEL